MRFRSFDLYQCPPAKDVPIFIDLNKVNAVLSLENPEGYVKVYLVGCEFTLRGECLDFMKWSYP